MLPGARRAVAGGGIDAIVVRRDGVRPTDAERSAAVTGGTTGAGVTRGRRTHADPPSWPVLPVLAVVLEPLRAGT